jgi:uncharacterized protein YjiK
MSMERALIKLLLAAALVSCAPPQAVEAQEASLFVFPPSGQVVLPNELREISGLAVAPDGRVFAHDDERAIIRQIDPESGAIVKSFSLGNPVLAGDFEGLAIAPDGVFWLTTSEGELHRFTEAADGAQTPYETIDSGLGDICEVEGLAYLPSEESLILACKQNKAREMRDTVSLYRMRAGSAAEAWHSLPEGDIASAAGVEDFRPSSAEIDARTGRILLLSSNDGAFAELDANGALLTARALGSEHTQPEAMTVLADGSLVISDEAAGDRPLLTRYARAP